MPDTSRMKPDFAVHLDGKKLQGEEAAAILGLRVYQTRSGATSFELIVSDPELKWQAKPTFTDCKEAKIELGAPGRLRTVFDGEVTAWRTELERSGPTVLVLRGLDRSHRMMRSHETRTYPNATPLDVAQRIATQYGLTARTRAGTPAPVKTFRFQANQSDFEFLAQMAEREGYLFWVEGSDLHFERPQLPTADDCEFTFGENLEAFLPSANFRKPPASVEVSGWDTAGKASVAAVAAKGQGLWTLPGGKHGADVAAFTRSKVKVKLVDSQVASRAHAETVARAALTRQSMEFLTGEVEVQGDPAVKPGAMVDLRKVGAYSGHYLVTEANHFYDAAGYRCIFYVARDKWGNSSTQPQQSQTQRHPRKTTQPQQGSPRQTPSQARRSQQSRAPSQQQNQSRQQSQAQSQPGPATASMRAALEAAHFQTDKAFPLPSSLPMFRGLAAAFAKEPQRTILVVGHTDSVGAADHNLDLSDERAKAAAAFLRDDVDAWMGFYSGSAKSAQWGAREDQLMLSLLPWGAEPYYDGEIDGIAGPGTRAALEAMQKATGLEVTGKADEPSRRALVREYMRAEGTTLDPSANVLTLGCGDLHKLDHTAGASEANRRVDVFLFEEEQMKPAPEDCRNGKHPGCDVYERWMKAVTATIAPDGKAPGRKPKRQEAQSELVAQARKLHKAMLDARDEQVAWTVEPERAGKKYIGEWCEGFASNDKLKKKIDASRLESDRQSFQGELAKKCEETERRCKELTDFIDAHPELREELDEAGLSGRMEGAALVQGIGECMSGSAWIEREMQDGEEGFLHWLVSPDGVEAGKKSWEWVETMMDAAAETAGTMVRVHSEEAVELFARILAVHFKVQSTDLIAQETVTVEGGIVKGVLYRRTVTVLTLEKVIEHEHVEDFGKILGAAGKVVAAVNFLTKLKVLHEDPGFKNVVGAVGAFAELLGATETATSFANKMTRAGRTLSEDGAPEAVETLAEAGELTARTATEFFEFLAETMARKLNVLAVVAGAADVVTGSMEAYEETRRDNIPGAIARGGIAVGGALMAIAGTMEIFGLAADSTFFGAPVGISVGILGLIVGAAGAVASFFTEESALEEWADHCEYGKHRRGTGLKEQIQELDKALYQVRVKGSILGWPFEELEIEPTCLTRISRLTCMVEISSASETRVPRKPRPIATDDEKCKIEFGEGELEKYVKKITLKLDIPRNLSGEAWKKMKVTFQLDPDASGKRLERAVELEQGMLDWILTSI